MRFHSPTQSPNAWSMIASARSISSGLTVNGGAIRHTAPRVGTYLMFIDSPSSM